MLHQINSWYNFQELSYEIDKNHDSYMEFMEQTLDKPDLLAQVTQGLKLQEKHLVYLELMIMEQVADWEIGTGLRKIRFFS